MNDPRTHHDARPADPTRLAVGEDLLPPVEPPSAGFIIQLFVVPALIVVVIVAVWLSFSWLVRRTATRPQDLIQGMEQGPSIARWQRANELADMLRNERFADFKRSGADAAQLAQILDRELEQASPNGGGQEDITLRYFLTRALGEFEVTDGIDVLVKAAETNRGPSDQLVRSGALEAIAVRAFNLRRLDPPQELSHPELEPALLRLAGDEDPLIRSQTAYTLGQIGTPAAIERLEGMADDPDADTRYNAAVALAHHGNAGAVETLAEMLNLDELTSVRADGDEQNRAPDRAVIVHTAIGAAQELAKRNPEADLSPIVESLEQLAAADAATLAKSQLPSRVASDAKRALDVSHADGPK